MSVVSSSDIKEALSKRYGGKDFFMTEVKTGSTYFPNGNGLLKLDAVSIARSWTSPSIKGFEIKVSRSDFTRDPKWHLYKQYCHEFYFVCPKGLIDKSELSEEIGLIWYNPETGALTTKRKAQYRRIELDADFLMYIIMYRLQSDRHPFHDSKVKYWKDWMEYKIDNKQMGHRASERIAKIFEENEEQKEAFEEAKLAIASKQDLLNMLRRHGIKTWRYGNVEDLEEQLIKRLESTVDPQLKNEVKNIAAIANRLSEMVEN